MFHTTHEPDTHRPCARCHETDPAKFGAHIYYCRDCRREMANERNMRRKQNSDFQRALDTLRLINSFPPRAA